MASTEQQIDDAVAKRHIQNTDTALGVQSSDLDMNQHKIIGLEDPTGDKDAANKEYVDDHAGGNVVGPSSAIADAIPLFDGITGLLIKDSIRLIEDVLSDGGNLPDGHAIKTYGDANWGGGSSKWTDAGTYIYGTDETGNTRLHNSGLWEIGASGGVSAPLIVTNKWGFSSDVTEGGRRLLVLDGTEDETSTPAIWFEKLYQSDGTPAGDPTIPVCLYVAHKHTGSGVGFTHSIMAYALNLGTGNNDTIAISGRARKKGAGEGDSCGVWGSAYNDVNQNGGVMGLEAAIYQNAVGMVAGDRLMSKWSAGLHVSGISTGSPAKAGIAIDADNTYRFWNAIIIDKNCFVSGGPAGTVGVNMGSCDSGNHPQYAIKFGIAGTHLYCNSGDLKFYDPVTGNKTLAQLVSGGGGYTNLTQFVDQTAWRLFYSNNLGDVTELGLGTSGQYLKATGASSAPVWDTPSGAGDVIGPGSAVANAVPLYNGTTGKLIKDSTRLIEDILTDGSNLPDGAAIKAYGDANWDNECINVKDYGAVGNGVTDDATAVQNALNAAYTGKKCVFVPEGTYIIGTTVTIKDDVTLRGTGWGSIFKAKSTLSGAILTNHNHDPGQNQYVLISDLYFDGNKTGRATGYCMYFNNLQWSRITNVKIENSPEYGIYLDGTDSFCDEISFVDCLFRYSENSGIYIHTASANMLTNCSFFSNNMITGYAAITINGGSQNVVNSCSIMSNYLHGIYLASSYSTTIKGCVIINNKRHGVYLGTSANDNIVDGNVCDGNSQGSSGTYSGIVLEGAALRNTITSNRCYNGLFTSNTQQYGIIETGAADYNVIVGNSLTGNISSDLVVVGTHTKAYHNMNVAEGSGSGDVVGPASAINNAVVLFNSTTGKLIKDSTRLIEDSLTDGSNLPDGAAIKAYGDANWGGGGGSPGGSNECIQYNSSGSFGGDTDFKWTPASNILNLANAEIQSLDSTNANFTLDSSPLIGAWTGWTYRGANVIKVKQAQVLPTNGSSHYFVDGLQVNHYDGDTTNYQSSSTQHEMHCVNIDMTGIVSSIQYKDMIGLSVRTLSRIGWTARGVSAITCETKQFGTGIASNEFHVFNPAVAEGGYEQSTSMAGLQIVMKPHRGDEDGSHVYRGLMIDNFGDRITHGIFMSSNTDGYGNGDMKYGLNMDSATITAAAIVMPASRTGHVGTVIEYAANDYSYYDRGSNIFQFVVGGNIKLSIDSGGIFTTSGTVEINTFGYAFKGKDQGGNMLNLAYAGATGYCMIGANCNYTNIGAGSSIANPVIIRVNGADGAQLIRSPDTDSQGKHYITIA